MTKITYACWSRWAVILCALCTAAAGLILILASQTATLVHRAADPLIIDDIFLSHRGLTCIQTRVETAPVKLHVPLCLIRPGIRNKKIYAAAYSPSLRVFTAQFHGNKDKTMTFIPLPDMAHTFIQSWSAAAAVHNMDAAIDNHTLQGIWAVLTLGHTNNLVCSVKEFSLNDGSVVGSGANLKINADSVSSAEDISLQGRLNLKEILWGQWYGDLSAVSAAFRAKIRKSFTRPLSGSFIHCFTQGAFISLTKAEALYCLSLSLRPTRLMQSLGFHTPAVRQDTVSCVIRTLPEEGLLTNWEGSAADAVFGPVSLSDISTTGSCVILDPLGTWSLANGSMSVSFSPHIAGLAISGPINLEYTLEGRTARMQPLTFRVNGGAVRISAVRADFGPPFTCSWKLSLNDLDLTPLAGIVAVDTDIKLSADLVCSLTGTDLTTQGSITISAYNGTLVLRDITVKDLFSPYREINTSLSFANIDLWQISRRCPYGSIMGILEGTINGLNLVGIEPNRFDAHIYTVKTSGVEQAMDLTALSTISKVTGGRGISLGGLEKLFQFFKYKQIAVSSTLANDKFMINGVKKGDKEYIIKGTLLPPKINVMNLSPGIPVSWKEMLRRIKSLQQN